MPTVIWLVPRMKYRLAVSGLLFHSYLDLLLRVFLPRTPSSSSASLRSSPPPTRISPRRSCKAKTFSARAIVRLLIALGFPLPSLPVFFSSYLNLSFFLWFLFYHTFSYFSYISSKLGGFSLALSFTCNFYLTDEHFFFPTSHFYL